MTNYKEIFTNSRQQNNNYMYELSYVGKGISLYFRDYINVLASCLIRGRLEYTY